VDYLENVRDLVDEADRRIKARSPPERRGPGRPPVEAADIAKVLLMQTYMGSPNRVAEGLLLIFREKLGISRHFSYKAIERGYDREAVNEILDEASRIANEAVKGKETRFAFDGTGFSGSTKENYCHDNLIPLPFYVPTPFTYAWRRSRLPQRKGSSCSDS
jgi:transposase